jgi:catechol 2,3-dioxygenase
MSIDLPYGTPPPAYRLPAAARVGAVRLQVSDLQRSVEYYREIIGLPVLSSDGGTARLGPSASRPLLELHERRGVHPVPQHGRLGLYHFAILVPDRATLGRFVAHLAETGAHAASADHAVSEAMYLWDPDGLGIEVYADRPRSEWRQRGRELYMTTEPLDLRGLIRAAPSAPWNGLPEGTTIGHMHLHVGDLAAGEAFYHRALGLDKVVWSYPGALFLSAGGYHHHLGINTWAAGAPPAAADEARLLQWELVLPSGADVQAAADSCGGAGFDVALDGVTRVSDPWGTPLALVVSRESVVSSR